MEYANDAPENIEHVRDMLNEVHSAKEQEDEKIWEAIYGTTVSKDHCQNENDEHGGVVNDGK